MINKVLSTAVKLFLRSQVEEVEELKFKIIGGDRQILSGYIPEVFLVSRGATYQGIQLRQVEITAETIRVNLAQILKGKPLRLLEPIIIQGTVLLEEEDLQASLQSPLLSQGLYELLIALLKTNGTANATEILDKYQFDWQRIILSVDRFTLVGKMIDTDGNIDNLTIHSGLRLLDSNTLHLYPLNIEASLRSIDFDLDRLEVDLGCDVNLQQVNLETGKLFCCGGLKVLP